MPVRSAKWIYLLHWQSNYSTENMGAHELAGGEVFTYADEGSLWIKQDGPDPLEARHLAPHALAHDDAGIGASTELRWSA